MLNLVKLCYVCLETDNNTLISVLTRDADGTTFLNKLQVCVATNLDENNVKQLCLTCLNQLQLCYKFRKMTLFAQNALHHNFNEILSGSYQREPVLNNMKLEISINCSHSKCLIDPINERSVSENTRSRTTKIKHEIR